MNLISHNGNIFINAASHIQSLIRNPRSIFIFSFLYLGAIALIILNQENLNVKTDQNFQKDEIRGAMEWRFQRLRDPATGEIPKNIRSLEIDFVSQLPGSLKFLNSRNPNCS